MKTCDACGHQNPHWTERDPKCRGCGRKVVPHASATVPHGQDLPGGNVRTIASYNDGDRDYAFF